MTDLLIQLSTSGASDWATQYNDLVYAPDDIQIYVMVSLLSNRGSWFGDTWGRYQVGSDLYLLQSTPVTSQAVLLLQAKDYATASLQWLVTEGLIQSFTVTTQMLIPTVLEINVSIIELPNQTIPLIFSYSIPL